jgi:hypothetical protein
MRVKAWRARLCSPWLLVMVAGDAAGTARLSADGQQQQQAAGPGDANFHQGERSWAPRKQAGHMSALDHLAEKSKNHLHRRGRPHSGTKCFPVAL